MSTLWIMTARQYPVSRDLTGSSGHITSGVLVGRVGVKDLVRPLVPWASCCIRGCSATPQNVAPGGCRWHLFA